MEDKLIKFDTALLAKEKGASKDLITPFIYIAKGVLWEYEKHGSCSNYDYTQAYTQTELHKWLREKHGIHIVVIPTVTAAWTYKTVGVLSERDDDVIIGLKSVEEVPPYTQVCGYDFNTYEEALEDGLFKSLKIIE